MKIHKLAFILLISLILPACSAGEIVSESGYAEVPSHIYEAVNDTLLIDAQVVGVSSDTALRTYIGNVQTLSQEKINSFLNQVGDSISQITDDQDGRYGYIFGGYGSRGSSFYYNSTASLWDVPPYMYFSYEVGAAVEWLGKYPIYYGQSDYDRNESLRLANFFEEPLNLSFAPIEEADAAIREALSILGLEDLVINRTLCLSSERLEEAVQYIIDNNWDMDGTGLSYPQKESWNESDECYIFEYYTAIDGIPMLYSLDTLSTSVYCYNQIIVYYNADGIIKLQIESPWTTEKVYQEYNQYVSAYEAMNLAKEKLENIIYEEKVVVTSIKLHYMYVQDGAQWLLVPVWQIKILQPNVWISDSFYYTYITIDARTGTEI